MTSVVKYRNPEKKKERSRFAARCRRNKEAEIFSQLSEMLPLPPKTLSLLDKASVMRLTISYLKIMNLLEHHPSVKASDNTTNPIDQAFLRALEGFLLVLSGDGDMVYLSKNVDQYLGLNQIDMMGHSIFEFSHPCDHGEIREMLLAKCDGKENDDGPAAPFTRPFLLRMKCTLNKKGRHVNLKSALYKVIHFTGKCVVYDSKVNDSNAVVSRCLVTVGEPIPHPSNVEVPLDKQIFLTQHSLNMKFTYVDERIQNTLGFAKDEMLGQSAYDFFHSYDSEVVIQSFKALFQKGQCQTGCYRFLAKNGGYVWVVTQATVICSNKSQKPQYIVCINYILSGIEDADTIVSSKQLSNVEQTIHLTREQQISGSRSSDDDSDQSTSVRVSPSSGVLSSSSSSSSSSSPSSDEKSRPPVLPPPVHQRRHQEAEEVDELAYCNSVPLPCTTKIFAPRTDDMNKGYLMFTGDDKDGMTVMNEEPEDLTHLAPTAGDDCIPLDFDSSGGMFDDVLFPDSVYESTAPVNGGGGGCGCGGEYEEQAKLMKSMNLQSTALTNDPFLSYKDQWSSTPAIASSKRSLDFSSPSVSDSGTDFHSSSQSSSPPQLEFQDEDDTTAAAAAELCVDDLKIPMMDRIARLLLEKRPDFDETDDFMAKANYIPVGGCVGGDFLPLTPSSSSSCDSIDFDSNSSKRYRAESSLARLLQTDVSDVSAARHIQQILAQREESRRQKFKSIDTRNKKTMLNLIKGINCLGASPSGTYFDSGGDGGGGLGQSMSFLLPKRENARQLQDVHRKSTVQQPQSSVDTVGGKRLAVGVIKSATTASQCSQLSSADLKRGSSNHYEGSAVSAKKARFQQTDTVDKPVEDSDVPSNSVLLNLLICGKDVSHGYTCVKTEENKRGVAESWERLPPALRYELDDRHADHSNRSESGGDTASIKSAVNNNHLVCGDSLNLLDSDVPSLASLLKLTQHDTEVNAPVKCSLGLLQGQDLLNALDQSMSLNEDLID